jgi:hypothetical protein
MWPSCRSDACRYDTPTDADIRASSDRYLRNSIIAVLAYDRDSTLWDAARLLSVGEEGYAYRSSVGARVRALPEFKSVAAAEVIDTRRIAWRGLRVQLRLLLSCEGHVASVLGRHEPAAGRGRGAILQVATADQCRVLRGLVSRQMRHQAAVAVGGAVTVHHEHASRRATPGDHFASAAVAVGVSAERPAIATCAALASRPGSAAARGCAGFALGASALDG